MYAPDYRATVTGEINRPLDAEQRPPLSGHEAAPFVGAVVAQLARSIEEAGAGAQEQVDLLTDRLTSILVACEQGDPEPAIRTLTEDPLLLSAIFQNIDLLYAHDYAFADALSMMTLDAVHRAVEAEELEEDDR